MCLGILRSLPANKLRKALLNIREKAEKNACPTRHSGGDG